MRALAFLILAANGCGFAVDDIDSVPDHPTYDADVRPLLADHCFVCHSERPSRHAPHSFRLDVYDTVDGVRGARAQGLLLLDRVLSDQMPPAAGWSQGVGPNGKELLRRWVDDGLPR